MEAMHDPKAYITEKQALAAIKNTGCLRDEILLKLLWYTGARVSEVLNIRIEDIDFTDGFINIKALKKKRVTKGGNPIPDRWRSIPIKASILQDIKTFLDAREMKDSPWLLTSTGDKPLTRQMAYHIVRYACEASGMNRCGDRRVSKRGLLPHPHMFRHGYAMDWYKKGGRPETLQRILGHEDYDTTLSYTRFTDKDLKEEYDKIKG